MSNVAIVTDSNSGITQNEAKAMGITVVPMPFYIDGELFYEDITLTQEEFYEKLKKDADISTSMPAIGDVLACWDELLKTYDEIVYIPMSSGLSSSCETAIMLSQDDDYDGKVFVVNNQRISITQKLSVQDAIALAERGWTGAQIKEYLERTKLDSSIYITLDTLKYLKKGGRITPAAAALGTLLRLKPVLQIQGEKLDAFSKCRTVKLAKSTMINAIQKDIEERFHMADAPEKYTIAAAYTCSKEEAEEWLVQLKEAFPNREIMLDPLSLSVACHIGAGSIAVGMVTSLDV